ncbi:hypothetical protein GQ53DRAFT_413833 [Thozetella sp. PMI_491]|nr:hypothetical protein GQ53DRAFT_413833 [Thozetella sp. PMI_491]
MKCPVLLTCSACLSWTNPAAAPPPAPSTGLDWPVLALLEIGQGTVPGWPPANGRAPCEHTQHLESATMLGKGVRSSFSAECGAHAPAGRRTASVKGGGFVPFQVVTSPPGRLVFLLLPRPLSLSQGG